MSAIPTSILNLDNVVSAFNEGTQTIENNMETLMTKIGNEANPSQADLMALQMLTIKWQSILQSQTGVMKVLGDTMKQIVANIGA